MKVGAARCVFVATIACLQLACEPESARSPAQTPGIDARVHPACAFPSAADAAQIDGARVSVRVLVAKNGKPLAVQTIQEPGFGFGEAAVRCVMSMRFAPALDSNGVSVESWSAPFSIQFVR